MGGGKLKHLPTKNPQYPVFPPLGFFVSLLDEAWSFFKLLDADAGGCVEINEFLMLGTGGERKVSVETS